MYLRTLSLRSFRNYSALELQLDPQLNVLVGNNAQGKTNLLEACYLLATTRSHRTHRDEEMIRWGDDFYHVKADIRKRLGNLHLELHYGVSMGRIAKVNGITQQRSSDFVGHLNVVLFAPEHLELVKGEPALRRRFLDMAIGQINRPYLHQLAQYNKLLQQKNNLLKGTEPLNLDLLSIYNQQLADLGSRLTIKRDQVIKRLIPLARTAHEKISGQERLEISYQASAGQPLTLESLRKEYEQLLIARQADEIRRRQSLIGPHRDDLRLAIDDVDLRHYGSQGQQRSAVLSLKMAETALMAQETGENPVLILDDVLSELDPLRQEQLLSMVNGLTQTLISSTDHPPLLAGRRVKSFLVKSGSVKELN